MRGARAMDKVLVDTDILSDFLRGKNAAVRDRARSYLTDRQRLTLSVVTVFEVVRGRHHAGQVQRAATGESRGRRSFWRFVRARLVAAGRDDRSVAVKFPVRKGRVRATRGSMPAA